MRDVGPLEPPQRERQRRRDAHPAVAEGRREVRHARAADRLDRRPRAGPFADVAERRRHDVDLVPARDEARDELPRDDDRAAERVCGPVGGDREQDPQRGAPSRGRLRRRTFVSVAVG